MPTLARSQSEISTPAYDIFYRSEHLSEADRKSGIESFLNSLAPEQSVRFCFERTPSTDGKTVWLGAIDAGDPHFEALALGHGVHEMMHVTDTDMTPFEKRSTSRLARALLNVLEDVRIDRLGSQRFSGYAIWRNALVEALIARNSLKAAQPPQRLSPDSLLCIWLHCTLMAESGFDWPKRFVEPLKSELLGHLPARALERIQKSARRIFEATDTRQAWAITQSVLRILSRLKSASDASRSQASASKLFADPQTQARAQAFLQALEDVTDAHDPVGIGAAVGAMQQVAPPAKRHSPNLATTPPVCDIWPDDTTNAMLRRDAQEYRKAFEKVTDICDTVSARIAAMLKTEAAARASGARSGTAFSRNWVQSVIAKRDDLFERVAVTRNVNAEICVLLDRSGSMGVHTMSAAKAAVLGLMRAIKPIAGCRARAACFPGPIDSKVSIVAQEHESLEAIAHRFAGISAYGSTPIDEAMQWAKESFTHSQARDRLLLLITDGAFPSDLSTTVQEQFNARGIELAVMSIFVDNSDICTNCCVLDRIDELPELLITLFSRTRFYQAVQSRHG